LPISGHDSLGTVDFASRDAEIFAREFCSCGRSYEREYIVLQWHLTPEDESFSIQPVRQTPLKIFRNQPIDILGYGSGNEYSA
jgi:hypothetical protein